MSGPNITVQDEATPALIALAGRVQVDLLDAMGPLVADLIAYTVRTKFETGNPYLRPRSYRAIKYIEEAGSDVRQQGELTTGIYGSPLPSVRAHEEGLQETVQVPAYRRSSANDKFTFARFPKRPASYGLVARRQKMGGLVRAHQKRMNLKARHMFRDALLEKQQDIRTVADEVVAQAIAEVSP